ncbi:MAG: hypothetical protein QOF09_3407 [Alphaproteobacteria bacterium]|jgi:hypothetical protein|nr:hypothetical protein [Alphaproteobacteria bacterium]
MRYAAEGYDADAIRADLASRNIKAVIPSRSNRVGKGSLPAATDSFRQ